MDKKLIERVVSIASEHVKWAGWEQWAELSLVELVTRCVDIIDAERGNKAVGTLCISHFRNDPGMENMEFQPSQSLAPGQYPLFLTPTIQEGMVMVPIETLRLFPELSGFLTAAQGERNVDDR